MLHITKQASRNKQYWQKLFSDFLFVLFIFCLAYMLSSYFNLSDNYFLWASRYEETLDIDELPISLLASFAALLWMSERKIYESNILMKQNHTLLQRVLSVQEIERKRISQDIHDELGQYLNAIKAQATGLTIDDSQSSETLHIANTIIDTADHGYRAARQMMHSLRPVALDELGLAAAIEHLVDTWRETQKAAGSHITYQTNIDSNLNALSDEVNIGLFRVVQEALTNIAKHTQADLVKIIITKRSDALQLMIQDNGAGFDVSATSSGYGVMGMIERIEALNGTISISSNEQGTTIHAEIPNEAISSIETTGNQSNE